MSETTFATFLPTPRYERGGTTPNMPDAAIHDSAGQASTFFGHIARADSRMDHTRALRSVISGLPRDWKRPPGRPRRTLLRTIEQDLRPLNIGFLCQLGNGLRIVNGGNGQWKRLRSRLGHAVDDDDDEISMTY